ncbi:MAG TPA: ornithine carbamoyltransferase [Gaiellaceae bacterium]|nr:ornithine carbamoyltransferase [Gaiellaceae bacterium]
MSSLPGLGVLPRPLALDLRGRSLTRVCDLSAAELEAVLDLAADLKRRQAAREPHRLLEGRTLGLLFRRPSTRTRVSLEVAIAHLGGAAVHLPPAELQLARGESLADTARVLSGYLDALAVRTGPQAEVDALAAAASIPVVNALTDAEHPLQALADLLTIRERLGGLEGIRLAWVGDGTNVCASLAAACTLLGVELVVACPPGYEPGCASPVTVVRDPREAAAGAHVLATDVWTSMGAEDERARRARDLAPYALDERLLALADPEAIVLHCLPAHPGDEISPGALYGPQSAVWEEAENRLHTAKALLALVLR